VCIDRFNVYKTPHFSPKMHLCLVWSLQMNKYYYTESRRGITYIKQNGKKANWIDCILHRNCLLKHDTDGKIKGRLRRRHTQLLDNLKKTRVYWNLKGEVQDRSQWRTRFGRGYGPVVRRTTERTKERLNEFLQQSLLFAYAAWTETRCVLLCSAKEICNQYQN
jgi:hypothetical protein